MAYHVTEKFAKKLMGENDIEAVLQRLDRLTMEESRMTVAQTMQVVLGLFSNMKIIMDGTQALPNISFMPRWISILNQMGDHQRKTSKGLSVRWTRECKWL